MAEVDHEGFRRLIRGEVQGPMATLARGALAAGSLGYRLGVGVRNRAFERGWKAIETVGAPVVSVGNLTLGGTGKTPMVEWVARWFRTRGARVAILSRGYGQAEGLNDEGRVLEDNLPDVPHYQGTDRVRLARSAVEESLSEVLVLDDGFQHRRLARDLDLVLLDALDPFGGGRIFPRGLLREPVGSLRRAGVVVLSRADLIDNDQRQAIRREAERRAGPIRWAEVRHAPTDLVDFRGVSEPLECLGGRKIGAFCGIGNPEAFRKTLERLGVNLVGFRSFPDHHPYARGDVADLGAWLRAIGADLTLTTQKDLVKVRISELGGIPLQALRIGLEVMEGGAILEESLKNLQWGDPGNPGGSR